MPEERNLNEIINELNERIYALEMIQRSVVAIISGQSDTVKDLLIIALEEFSDLRKGIKSEIISKTLNSYIRLAKGEPSGDYKQPLYLVPSDKKDDKMK